MGLVEIHGLSKHFQNGSETLEVLKNIHLNIARNEICVIKGPSGSGKSTLLNCVAGLEEPTAGKIHILGQNILTMDETDLAMFRGQHVGFVFQSFRLIPTLTALENVRLPLDLQNDRDAKKKAKACLEKMDLGPRVNHLPGLLSGGEQQRVAIARAMVITPDLLMADEPTGNLDSENGRRVLDVMLELVKDQQAALLIVTHEEALFSCSHRVVVLTDGSITGDDHAPGERHEKSFSS